MNTIAIKSRLQKLIDEQDDIDVLKAIYTLLQKTSLNPVLKTKLTNRAKKAKEDIAAGRIFFKKRNYSKDKPDRQMKLIDQYIYITDFLTQDRIL